MGHCGHGKDKPIGPGQLSAMGDGSHLNVFHSLRYLAVILIGGLNNPINFSLGGRDSSRGVFLNLVPFKGKMRRLRISGVLKAMSM